jgi:dolichyl-diphosphooligosaccharide--protein glycosyltransferase
MAFACSQGVRFVLFLFVPLGIASGVIIQEAYEYLKDERKKLMVFPAAIIIGLLLGNCFINAYDTARHLYPLLQDSDYEILSSIKENTPSEAVINSWWDYGDWFKVIARRRVIFDGQSQNEPQAYWMAYVLLNSDEKEILGILRLLNNGGNKGYEVINGYFKDPIKSILFLKKIVSVEPWIAKDVLKKSLPPALAEEVTGLFFHKPAKAYFIVDASMKDKIGAISYIGEWDFVKVYIAQNINKKTKDEIKNYLCALYVDAQKIERFYNEAKLTPKKDLDSWFTRWLRFKSEFVSGKEKDGLVLFSQGIVYRPKEKLVYIYSNKHKDYQVPVSLFLFENSSLEEIHYQNNDLKFSVLIIKKGQDYQAILLDRKLATSLFVKLFYLDGAGLKNFKPVLEQQSKGGDFRVFEIVWD